MIVINKKQYSEESVIEAFKRINQILSSSIETEDDVLFISNNEILYEAGQHFNTRMKWQYYATDEYEKQNQKKFEELLKENGNLQSIFSEDDFKACLSRSKNFKLVFKSSTYQYFSAVFTLIDRTSLMTISDWFASLPQEKFEEYIEMRIKNRPASVSIELLKECKGFLDRLKLTSKQISKLAITKINPMLRKDKLYFSEIKDFKELKYLGEIIDDSSMQIIIKHISEYEHSDADRKKFVTEWLFEILDLEEEKYNSARLLANITGII